MRHLNGFVVLWLLVVAMFPAGFACIAPRAMTQTGRVTPAQELRAEVGVVGNIPTATPGAILKGLDKTVDNLIAKDDRLYEDGFNAASKAAVAYSVDPVSMGYSLGVRYGVIERLDAGYKWAAGAHAIDTRFQFLGAPGKREKEGEQAELAGAVGVQYSQQSYELPSIAGLDKLSDLLGFHMKRRDILLPVTFSYPFGGEEKYGAIAWGVVGGYTFLDYGLEPHDLIKNVDGVEQAVSAVSREQAFATFGGFVNVKGGYKWGYVGLGLALYYQDYGTFEILDQAKFELKGFTVVPTLSIEGRY